MKNSIWKAIAWIVSIRFVTSWIINRSLRTPYYNLEGYMNRWWVFNPYGKDENGKVIDPKHPHLPSIRVHHILREDLDRALHDHPWDARSIILEGWYHEIRKPIGCPECAGQFYIRQRGDTSSLKYGEYHTITKVSPGGVFTLFFTWKYQGMWGFLVNGIKVPWKEYLKESK